MASQIGLLYGPPASAMFHQLKHSDRAFRLVAIKILHTIIWAIMVGSILALPVAALTDRFDWAVALSLLVLVECSALAMNGGRCPLTKVASRYTQDRADNFDIYLPEWLARHNKAIFGTLFVAGLVIFLWRWLT